MQASGSAATQNMGSPGQLIFSWSPPDGSANITVSFNPALAQMVQPQFGAFQRINISDSGRVHVFQISTNEELRLPIEFHDIPWDDDATTNRQTSGMNSLRAFIRTTLNYAQETFQVTTPDGDIETVRCLNGIEFTEAADRAQRHLRWSGRLELRRQL